ncbi:unnamed protein product [Symbiodinium natans]|uniref:Uncharacterized protein n=1 Tax=Symbiodinium natans TaxID=878477 RepID=A0A812LU15_9DINO|nr:unnamed protein product [Symbiodinium natans]
MMCVRVVSHRFESAILRMLPLVQDKTKGRPTVPGIMFSRVVALLALLGAVHAVTRPHFNEAYLHQQMREMMTHDPPSKSPQKPSTGGSMDMEDDDPYMQEAADGLSKALGPGWNKQALEADADRKTSALLKGISGSSRLRGLTDMLGSLR